MGVAFGAVVARAPRLMHGKTSPVRHLGYGVFADLPNPFEATRYHSLVVNEETLSDELEPIAWSDDGQLMAMRHRDLPYWGVQFHPESVLTGSGPHLLGNFLDICGGCRVSDVGAGLAPAREGVNPSPTLRKATTTAGPRERAGRSYFCPA
jgi:GMP synthase-like glutamine amidotransferase